MGIRVIRDTVVRLLLFVVLLLAGVSAASAAVVADKDRFGNVDGRGSLADRAEQLGISGAEEESLRAAMGYLICPGSSHDNGIVASAALVGSGRVIVTVGHALVDEEGRARAPLSACIFRSQSPSAAEVPLVGADAVWIGLAGPARPHDPRDYAVALLAGPVPGGQPLAVRSTPLAAGERVVGIVAWQEIPGLPLDPNIPVVQDCAVRDLETAEGTLPTNYLTDCDLGPVGSGGHLLTRIGGRWATSGIFSSSGGDLSVGRSYSRRLGSFTRGLALDAGFAQALDSALATAGR